MIKHIGSTHVFVHDQDRAKAFFLDKVGFELVSDQPMFPGTPNRWLSVRPKGAVTELVLLVIDEQSERFRPLIGTEQGIIFEVDDLMAEVERLRANGVEISQEPSLHPWGGMAWFKDSEGNQYMLHQKPQQG